MKFEVLINFPTHTGFSFREFGPKILTGFLSVWNDYSANLPPTNEAIVPAEIVIQQQIKRRWLDSLQRLNRSLLVFCFEATTPKGSLYASGGKKHSLSPNFLRA